MKSYVIRTHYKSDFTGEELYQDVPVTAASAQEARDKAVEVVMSDSEMRPASADEIQMQTMVMVFPKEGE